MGRGPREGGRGCEGGGEGGSVGAHLRDDAIELGGASTAVSPQHRKLRREAREAMQMQKPRAKAEKATQRQRQRGGGWLEEASALFTLKQDVVGVWRAGVGGREGVCARAAGCACVRAARTVLPLPVWP